MFYVIIHLVSKFKQHSFPMMFQSIFGKTFAWGLFKKCNFFGPFHGTHFLLVSLLLLLLGLNQDKEMGTTIKVITNLVFCNANFKPYIIDFM